MALSGVESKIMKHAKAIYKIVKQEDYPSGYLSLCIMVDDGYIHFNNDPKMDNKSIEVTYFDEGWSRGTV